MQLFDECSLQAARLKTVRLSGCGTLTCHVLSYACHWVTQHPLQEGIEFDGRLPLRDCTTALLQVQLLQAQEERSSDYLGVDNLSVSRYQLVRIADDYGKRKQGMQAGPTGLDLSAFLVTYADVPCHILHEGSRNCSFQGHVRGAAL